MSVGATPAPMWASAFAILLAACGSSPPAALDIGRCEVASFAAPAGCADDRDCSGGERCSLDGAASTDGEAATQRCAASSGTTGEGDDCEAAAECASGLCSAAGTCVIPCSDDEVCAEAARCRPLWVRGEGAAMHETRACADVVVLPEDIAVVHTRVRTEAAMGEVFVDLPEHAGVVVVAPECRAPATGDALVAADGTVLFDRAMLVAGGDAPALALADVGPPFAFRTLASPDDPLFTSGLRVRLSDASTREVRLTTLSRERRGGTLDLDLFYVGVAGLAPEGERGPPAIAAALAEVETAFASAGVTIGEVRQHAIEGALATRLRFVDILGADDPPDLDVLRELSAAPRGPSVAVFFVRRIDFSVALSGGIPGPLGFPGTRMSGVVIGMSDIDAGGLSLGGVLAHELGHELGLFHTTEANGVVLDPLDDTPSCPLSADVNDDGVLRRDECAAVDGNNLMFWQAAETVGTLTATQAAVIAAAPVLR